MRLYLGNIMGPKGDDAYTMIDIPYDFVLPKGVLGYKDGATKMGDGVTPWIGLPAFAMTGYSFGWTGWRDIARIAAAGEASKYFHVGDEKTITLSTGEAVTLVILGFDHDDLTGGGKAPITIGMKNCLAARYPMNESNTNAGGWEASVMRTQTMSRLLTELPEALQEVIKPVIKKTSKPTGDPSIYISSSTDKLFLLAPQEIYEQVGVPPQEEGTTYAYYKTVKIGTVAENRIKYLSNGDGAAVPWWLRTPYVSSAYGFYVFYEEGGLSSYGDNATREYGVSFAFCI